MCELSCWLATARRIFLPSAASSRRVLKSSVNHDSGAYCLKVRTHTLIALCFFLHGKQIYIFFILLLHNINIFASSLSHSALNCSSRADVTFSGDHGRNHCSEKCSVLPAQVTMQASSYSRFTNASSRPCSSSSSPFTDHASNPWRVLASHARARGQVEPPANRTGARKHVGTGVRL